MNNKVFIPVSLVSLAFAFLSFSNPLWAAEEVSAGGGVQSEGGQISPELKLDLESWQKGLPVGQAYHFDLGDLNKEANVRFFVLGKDYVFRNNASYDTTLIGPMNVPVGPARISGGVATVHFRNFNIGDETISAPDVNDAKFLELRSYLGDSGFLVSGRILKGASCADNLCSDIKDSKLGIEYRPQGSDSGYVLGASVSNSSIKLLDERKENFTGDHVLEFSLSKAW